MFIVYICISIYFISSRGVKKEGENDLILFGHDPFLCRTSSLVNRGRETPKTVKGGRNRSCSPT